MRWFQKETATSVDKSKKLQKLPTARLEIHNAHNDTHHSCWGSSMTKRILNFLDREGDGADCSTNAVAEAAVCLTALVMELKELKNPEEPPEEEVEEDWAGCWACWLGRRSWAAGELAGALVGDWAGAAPCWGGEAAAAAAVAVGGTGAGGSGLWRSVM